MGVALPWLVLIAFQSYQHGYKQNKMPEPFYFLGASGAMAIAGIVAMWDPRVGTLFAWALLAGAFVSGQVKSVEGQTEQLQMKKVGSVSGNEPGIIPKGAPLPGPVIPGLPGPIWN